MRHTSFVSIRLMTPAMRTGIEPADRCHAVSVRTLNYRRYPRRATALIVRRE